MTVISVPTRLRLAAATLFLCIPWMAIEVMIASRAPSWRVPFRTMGYWSFAVALICIPLASWFISIRRWAFPLALLLSALWLITSTWVAIRMRYPPLGFFTLFLLAFFSVLLFWLRYEMNRSFLNPQLAWYEGLPKPIPGLKCQLSSGEKQVESRVSRIDKDGVFVFSPQESGRPASLFPWILENHKFDMVFHFKDRQLVCQGIPTLSIDRGVGAGFQFLGVSSDLRKEIGDFVEILRGEGYV